MLRTVRRLVLTLAVLWMHPERVGDGREISEEEAAAAWLLLQRLAALGLVGTAAATVVWAIATQAGVRAMGYFFLG